MQNKNGIKTLALGQSFSLKVIISFNLLQIGNETLYPLYYHPRDT